MTNTRKTGRIKKYGVCLYDKCENYKIIQELVHGELECPGCHRKLSPCAPPKKRNSKKPIYICVAAILIIGLIIGGFVVSPCGTEEPTNLALSDSVVMDNMTESETAPAPKQDTVVVTDTVVLHDTIMENNTITTSERISTKTIVNTTSTQKNEGLGKGTIRFSYGTYTGATKDGFPHGQGRLVYSTIRQINRNDTKGRKANSGDYVIGEFYNGFVVYGKHYDSEGNLLESLNFGVGSESSYESK
jgi:hypothetical protein